MTITRKQKKPNLTPHLKELEEQQQTKPRVNRRKEIIKIRAEFKGRPLLYLSFYFLSNPKVSSLCFFPASLIYHQWILCNLLMPPLSIVMYKIRCKMAFSGVSSQSFEILLPGNCHQFGANKLIKILIGLDVSFVDK